jgi:DNA-binding SARP family transcriptional activator
MREFMPRLDDKPPLRPATRSKTTRSRLSVSTHSRARSKPLRGAPQHLTEIRLINGFELVHDDQPVSLPLSVQHLLALLAFHERPLQRVYVAGKLWLESTEERAFASLRSTLWRTNQPGIALVNTQNSTLALADGVRVDLRAGYELARRLVDGSAHADVSLSEFALVGELLPDWYDDWVLLERERYRQLSLHALEALADRLTALARFGEAADAALAAIAGEPLRESSHRALIRVHLAEGNPSEALREYEIFRQMLDRLGLAPSSRLEELIGGLTVQ